MFLIDFINPYTVLFLVVVFLLAYLLKKSFAREELTPEGAVEELYPLLDDETRASFQELLQLTALGSANVLERLLVLGAERTKSSLVLRLHAVHLGAGLLKGVPVTVQPLLNATLLSLQL